LAVEKPVALVYIDPMRRDDIISKLKAAEPALRARGIRRAALFGSIARGEERPDSDIDILVEFEPGAEGSIYEYMNLKEFIAGLFDGPVDVIDRDALKPHLRAPAARDTVYAF
jgi:predicted nucleotidyltransferase